MGHSSSFSNSSNKYQTCHLLKAIEVMKIYEASIFRLNNSQTKLLSLTDGKRWGDAHIFQFCLSIPSSHQAKKWIPSKWWCHCTEEVVEHKNYGLLKHWNLWNSIEEGDKQARSQVVWSTTDPGSTAKSWAVHAHGEILGGQAERTNWELNGDVRVCAVLRNMDFWPTQSKQTSLTSVDILKSKSLRNMGYILNKGLASYNLRTQSGWLPIWIQFY